VEEEGSVLSVQFRVYVYYSYDLHAQYGCATAQAIIRSAYSLGSTPGQVNVCWWHEKWYWERFLNEYFSFCLPISLLISYHVSEPCKRSHEAILL
jgi:hypothetical protein